MAISCGYKRGIISKKLHREFDDVVSRGERNKYR